jgi:hypothetical protein
MPDKPPVEQFIKLPRDLLASDAWRSLSVNGRRLLDFLMLEQLRHGGKANGRIKAPYRQLVDFGIGDHLVAPAIRETEELGLIECHHGGMRVATTFALAWLPLADGKLAAGAWRDYHNPSLKPLPERRRRRA